VNVKIGQSTRGGSPCDLCVGPVTSNRERTSMLRSGIKGICLGRALWYDLKINIIVFDVQSCLLGCTAV
jgi:hypothetical protein